MFFYRANQKDLRDQAIDNLKDQVKCLKLLVKAHEEKAIETDKLMAENNSLLLKAASLIHFQDQVIQSLADRCKISGDELNQLMLQISDKTANKSLKEILKEESEKLKINVKTKTSKTKVQRSEV